jgi:hypothetical protein
MKHCRRCVYPETKPNLWFDNTGLCSACVYFDRQSKIDWPARTQEFSIKFPRGTRVVAAVSGGKDSTYIVVKLMELGLKVLAVCATTDDLTPIGRRNLDNIGRLTDLIEVTPNKTLRRQMSKYALETVGDISWCEHVLIWTTPAQIADLMGIGHVFYGENPQNAYGAGPDGTERLAGMPPQWEQEFGGMLGLRVSDMQEQFPDGEFGPYKMPKRMPTRHFLGYYFPWDGGENAKIARQHGFEWYGGDVETSCVPWENLDNHQTGLHDLIRYYKYGYTRAHDILGSAIRRGRLDRPLAATCIKCLDPYPHTYIGKPIKEILDDIGMTRSEFWAVVYRFTNWQLFDRPVLGFQPTPKFEIE